MNIATHKLSKIVPMGPGVIPREVGIVFTMAFLPNSHTSRCLCIWICCLWLLMRRSPCGLHVAFYLFPPAAPMAASDIPNSIKAMAPVKAQNMKPQVVGLSVLLVPESD